MSLLGKLLLVFNLLAAGGFVYLATQDWKGRQTINAGGLRHLLVLQGLPLDGPANFPADGETPFRMEGAGGLPTTTVSKKLLDSYFQGIGATSSDPNTLTVATAVPNQLAEAARVKGKVEELLGKAESPAAKIALLKGWLLYQVDTFPERVEILALAAPEKEDPENGNQLRAKTAEELTKDAEDLQKHLLARFDGVVSAPKPLDGSVTASLKDEELAAAATEEEKAKLVEARLAKIQESRIAAVDENDRRRKLAHLLVHLSPESGWQKRVMAVVGIREYVKTIQSSSRRLQTMAIQIEQYLHSDQQGYFDHINGQPGTSDTAERRGLRQEAEDKTSEANRQAALRAKWVEQHSKDADLVAQRKTQLADLTNQLTKVKTQVDTMLSQQTTIESGLFEVQREVAITLDEVYQFEKELAERERKLAGGGK